MRDSSRSRREFGFTGLETALRAPALDSGPRGRKRSSSIGRRSARSSLAQTIVPQISSGTIGNPSLVQHNYWTVLGLALGAITAVVVFLAFALGFSPDWFEPLVRGNPPFAAFWLVLSALEKWAGMLDASCPNRRRPRGRSASL